MPDIWGQLPKAQDNPQTIEEAIVAAIAAHEADSDAHLGASESLQSHKASEIIDHLALSIVEDKIGDGEVSLQKLTATNRIIMCAFESLDCWDLQGPANIELPGVKFDTIATSNDYGGAISSPFGINGLIWSKDFFWQSTLMLNQIVGQIVYVGVGATVQSGGVSGAGFKIINNELYCYHAEDTGAGLVETTFQLFGYTLTDSHVYRIFYDQSEGSLEFFIDGVSLHTFGVPLPTNDDIVALNYEIKTTQDVAKSLIVHDVLLSVPR